MSRVLLIDDDKVILEFIGDLLTKSAPQYYQSPYDLKITKVESAAEAISLFDQGLNFELVITDVLMAHMSGWELIKKLREKYSQGELPIVVISAVDGVELAYQCSRAGASAWFTKPIKINEFCKTVFNLLLER